MKKLLVLMLVLGMASMASAIIVSPIDIDNSGGTMATIGIDLPSGMSNVVDGSGGYWALISSSTDVFNTPDAANPVTGGMQTLLAPSASGVYGAVEGAGVGLANGVYGFFGDYGAIWSTGPGIYADNFGGTAAYVSLYHIASDFGSTSHIVTKAVPEPMTIALLGLGSLFMLRRRK